ncbi:MAG: DUF2493 domain-containing protein, partial [Aestuariibacter sp.]|nr:DUF2493 domain-containing protein [Aestuariibacter sp.]
MDDQKETLEGLTENYKTETSSSNSEISGMEFNELQMSSYNPYEDEHETRPLPDGKCVEGFLSQLFDDVDDLFGESRLEEQGHNIMWGLVNVFDRQAKQTNNALDKNQREMRNLMDQQDGSEVKSNQLEQVQSDCLKFEETLEVFEKMRDHASLKYTHYTNRDWMPYSGSKVNTKAQTASMVDSRDYLRQKAIAKNNTLIPEGRKFVITGGADYNDHEKIWNTLSNTLAKNPDMVL